MGLPGRTVVFVPDFAGPTWFDGNGTARLCVDDGASSEQLREIEAILQMQKGGPMEVIGGLVSTYRTVAPRPE